MTSNSTGGRLAVAAVGLAPPVLQWRRVHRGEVALLASVVSRRSPLLRSPARLVTELGAPVPVVMAVAGAAGWSYRRGVTAREIARSVGVGASGLLVRWALAEAVRRERPPQRWWWSQPSGHSYPSRHVTWVGLGSGVVGDLLAAAGGMPARRSVATAVVAGVAATRVVIAVHWPSDVIAAVCFATGWRRMWR